jgi:hypothetical protein
VLSLDSDEGAFATTLGVVLVKWILYNQNGEAVPRSALFPDDLSRNILLNFKICDTGVARRMDLSDGFRLLTRHGPPGVQLISGRLGEVDMK